MGCDLMGFFKKNKKIDVLTPVNPDKSEFQEKTTVSKLTLPVSAKTEGHTAEDIRLIIAEWLKPEHIKRKTRFNTRQVRAVSILQSLADTYHIKTLQRFLDEFRTNKLSEDGQSSKELENILKARMPELQEDNALSKLNRFLE
jgi:hypothetical protein